MARLRRYTCPGALPACICPHAGPTFLQVVPFFAPFPLLFRGSLFESVQPFSALGILVYFWRPFTSLEPLFSVLFVFHEPFDLEYRKKIGVRRSLLSASALVESLPWILSYRMYYLNSFRKSTPPQNRQLSVYYY